jgi:hypothetical protein
MIADVVRLAQSGWAVDPDRMRAGAGGVPGPVSFRLSAASHDDQTETLKLETGFLGSPIGCLQIRRLQRSEALIRIDRLASQSFAAWRLDWLVVARSQLPVHEDSSSPTTGNC